MISSEESDNLKNKINIIKNKIKITNNMFYKRFYHCKDNNYECRTCKKIIRTNKLFKHPIVCVQKVTLNDNIIIDEIIHMADIHIRLNSRLDEYEYVFNNLYKSLENLKQDNKNRLIVICGDLLHSKSNLSPECIMMCWNFLNNLSKFYPVILIAGNHDAIMNNEYKIDSITAILKDRPLNNIHYLPLSGIY